ncbi:immunoglobulin superfamily member 1-like [Mixophyes fleayi]|uniref:immunoglobulin superfamily member 1-like n=1 Tax=Mixophyes fleayi TaxID=3061075 RepID=UPI003F4D95AC
MNVVVFFIVTVTCCLLVTKQWVSGSALPKPSLELITNDPRNIIVMGDTITLKCVKGSQNANNYYLLHINGTGHNGTLEESSGEFLFRDIKNENNGNYACRYRDAAFFSEFSSSLNIFVQEKFPRPSINVSPRRVVQPGAAITITCRAHRANIRFTILKNNAIITQGSDDGSKFSYVINAANNENEGYYSCIYESKNGSSVHLKSVRSNPMRISVLGLAAPSLTCEEDPNDSRKFRINCTIPESTAPLDELYFFLLNGSKLIENEVRAKDKSVTFIVAKPPHITKKYLCMYQIEHDSEDLADSLYSAEKYLWEDLPQPSMHLEPDSTNDDMKIRCMAPREYKEMQFQLLNDTRVIAEHATNHTSSAIFTIKTSQYPKEKLSCSYRIRLDCGFVDSRSCKYFSDTYTLMFVRHILSALVLILMGIIILMHFRGLRKAEEYRPALPSTRVRFEQRADDTQVVWK